MTGCINTRRFFISGSIGFGALIVVLITLLLTGTVFAALPIAGLGDFKVTATKIQGDGFQLIPALSDINNSSTNTVNGVVYPVSQLLMDRAHIDGLKLNKYLDLTPFHAYGLPADIDHCVFDVTVGGQAIGENVILNASQIEAANIVMNSMVVDENYQPQNAPANNPFVSGGQVPIGVSATTVDIDQAIIKAHYLAVGNMTMPQIALAFRLDDNTSTGTGGGTQPITP